MRDLLESFMAAAVAAARLVAAVVAEEVR